MKIEAEKTFSAAKIAVQEYIEGTYPQSVQTADVAITVAMENLRSAENSFQHAQRMARKGYVTSLERDARAFAVERAKLDLETARLAKEVLEKFTKPKTVEDLESKRDTAEAKMHSEEAAFELEESHGSSGCKTQLEKCVIRAPQTGMVIYANEPGGQRGQQAVQIEEGAAVRERQSIIRLPDLATHAGQNPRPRIEGRSAAHRHAGQPARCKIASFKGTSPRWPISPSRIPSSPPSRNTPRS